MEKRRNLIKASVMGLAAVPMMAHTPKQRKHNEYNMIALGAKPDGETLNTKLIQQAIDRCSANGGGTVLFPPGKYLTGAIALKSGVTLYLEKGSILLGSTNLEHYVIAGTPRPHLINAGQQENIGISGEGTIDGQGGVFVRPTKENSVSHRPLNINFRHCRNVKVEGIFLTNSGSWMQHYFACENLQIRGIQVYNHCNFNNDGIDIDGCRDVIISDCIVDSDDDGICLKSTREYNCENVLVNNCLVRSFCNALKLGTESVGGFRNVVISNCSVTPCEPQKRYYGYELGESAISLELVDGGILEQVTVDNITIRDTGCPLFIRLGNRGRNAPGPGVGTLKNVRISNIMATTTSVTPSSITGIQGYYAENIHLDNITLKIDSVGKKEFADMEVPEDDAGYPTARMYGEQLPAAALFVRHAKNIRFSNMHLIIGKENELPALVFDDVKNAKIFYPELHTVNGNELIKKTTDSEVRLIR